MKTPSLALLFTLAAFPLHAEELWCMPALICAPDGTDCAATTDEETSVRLADLGAAQTSMRSNAEDIAMTREDLAAVVVWRGVNAAGLPEILEVQRDDLSFLYSVEGANNSGLLASGRCEVQ